ncbi:MAG: hypothetical protein JWQ90_5067 [Hydrocarboniphaga sp.]|uniref:DUF1302 domain-containing protein n=1 Tax=Hydrocarboniphaga sp. TaxID=2033016 RepID=UPI00262BA166|nr:DUF1302 family protein [Hydrocarboniphaga sp.]MDB5972617.1 hypothetical protein [Hydrocarboniphaga sp.]
MAFFSKGRAGLKSFNSRIGTAAGLGLLWAPAAFAGFSFMGIDSDYQLSATYSAAVRVESPSNGIINPPPPPEIPVADFLKVSQYNYDDGDQNFNKGSMINNRLTFLGELNFSKNDYGMVLRGDAFYDRVYRKLNDNNSPDTINKLEGPTNQFTDDARYNDGRRARLLDAYIYGSWYIGDESALNVRLGRHIAAYGESLFFSGISFAQAPADATKAAVPGADVKSILLPVNQISAQFSLNDKISFVGQYKLEFKPTELYPVGEYFSPADVVGPGAEFIYGLKNPLYFANYQGTNLLSTDTLQLLQTATGFLGVQLPAGAALSSLLTTLDGVLPDVPIPIGQIPQPGQPQYINVMRGPDIRPSDYGQYSLGVKYQITPTTNVGVFRLRYHDTNPAPVQNYGSAPLLVGPNGAPLISTGQLGLLVPVSYNIRYFDGVDMTAMSMTTSLFGANIGMDLTYRQGTPVLVDADGGIQGPIPTPVRGDVGQIQFSGLYTIGPRWFWDTLTLVGEIGYNNVFKHEQACAATADSCRMDLTNTRDASAVQVLVLIDKKNVVPAWDATIPIVLAAVIDGQSSLLGGFGQLNGPGDYRASVGITFTRLQALQLGIAYNAYIGSADYKLRPLQDRDNVSVSAKYNF